MVSGSSTRFKFGCVRHASCHTCEALTLWAGELASATPLGERPPPMQLIASGTPKRVLLRWGSGMLSEPGTAGAVAEGDGKEAEGDGEEHATKAAENEGSKVVAGAAGADGSNAQGDAEKDTARHTHTHT